MEAEVFGNATLSLLAGMESPVQARRIFSENGIELREGEWYPQKKILDSLRSIFRTVGPATLRAIGRSVPNRAVFPPSISSVEDGLRAIQIAYGMNHRGIDPTGAYSYSPDGVNSAKVSCDNPYPCSLDMGILEGVADKFRSGSVVHVRVSHIPGTLCRDKGGTRCVYLVEWPVKAPAHLTASCQLKNRAEEEFVIMCAQSLRAEPYLGYGRLGYVLQCADAEVSSLAKSLEDFRPVGQVHNWALTAKVLAHRLKTRW